MRDVDDNRYKILLNEWDVEKNGQLNMNEISNKNSKVWWICKERHSWLTRLRHRMNGSNCPYCAGKLAHEKNNLQLLYPQLALEWNYEKNKGLIPNMISPQSSKKYWWKCLNDHEYSCTPNNRTKGRGCPQCRSLIFVYPDISNEWCYELNVGVDISKISKRTGRIYWWKCSNNHEWQSSVDNRARGNGCPYCSNQKTCFEKSILVTHPHIAEEWHPLKNEGKTPQEFVSNSNLKFWWIGNCGHEWEAVISSRVRGSNCPFCSKKYVCLDNCLMTKQEKLAIEWNYSKNNDLTPYDVTEGSTKIVWWVCEKGHEWKAKIRIRAIKGSNCPECNQPKGEKSISDCLNKLNVKYEVQYRFKDCKDKYRLPFDFAVFNDDGLFCLIEYDGEQHEKPLDFFGGESGLLGRRKRDAIKDEYCNRNNIKLIRIPYGEFDSISTIIEKELSELNYFAA